MTILSGQTIMRRKPIANMETRTEVSVGGRHFTFGCGPAGYDLRLEAIRGQALIGRGGALGEYGWQLEPGQFVLASAAERFQMPDDLLGVVHDKSSWARLGLAVQNTVIEPGWCGFLTLELTNHSREPLYQSRRWQGSTPEPSDASKAAAKKLWKRPGYRADFLKQRDARGQFRGR